MVCPEDVKEVVNLLGEIFNKPEKAEEYSKYFDDTLEKVNRIVSQIPEDKKSHRLKYYIGEIVIRTCDSRMVDRSSRWCKRIRRAKKDGILGIFHGAITSLGSGCIVGADRNDKKLAYSGPRFSHLKAVKNKKVYATPVMGHVWANRTMEQPLTVIWAAKLFIRKK